ncbi:hypothetical protein BaRGS_00012378 [Batillaria attramentaria]|uniref:Uncharacterized protein n=1 Tax=Batillaria attramentaria TaxID=370345 RepID=A0ABD0LB11_9CAEN
MILWTETLVHLINCLEHPSRCKMTLAGYQVRGTSCLSSMKTQNHTCLTFHVDGFLSSHRSDHCPVNYSVTSSAVAQCTVNIPHYEVGTQNILPEHDLTVCGAVEIQQLSSKPKILAAFCCDFAVIGPIVFVSVAV